MPSRSLLLSFAMSLILINSVNAAEDDDRRHLPTASFEENAMAAIGYAAGILDTLAYLDSGGQITPLMRTCIFSTKEGPTHRQVMVESMTSFYITAREHDGLPDISPAEAFFELISKACPEELFVE